MTSRELATVLVALRHWQNYLESHVVSARFDDHFVDYTPLSIEEIDVLCEELNFAAVKR